MIIDGHAAEFPEASWINLADFDILVLNETSSTNDDALALAANIPGEFVIWTENQTAGRGRKDRSWFSSEGSSLTFSVLMHPVDQEIPYLSHFTALGALALTDLLKSEYAVQAEIKWPNDVLIRERKVCGILTEINWSGSKVESLVMGMGINLSSETLRNAKELRFPATSLETEKVNIDSVLDFLEKLLYSIQQRRKQLGSAQFIADWNQHLAFKGKYLPIKQYQGKTEMLCPGSINADGSLNARDQAGNWHVVQSAEFSPSSSISGASSSS